MNGDYCSHCKHSYQNHVFLRSVWVLETEIIELMDEKVIKQLEKNTEVKDTKVALIKGMEAKTKFIEKEISNLTEDLKQAIKKVKEVCSEFNYEKELELSVNILNNELWVNKMKDKKESKKGNEAGDVKEFIKIFNYMLVVVFGKNIINK